MKPKSRPATQGFTLIELLVVIAIIAILAALLLPALSMVKTRVLQHKAKMQIAELVLAIHDYENHYGVLPVSSQALVSAAQTGSDFTYGTFGTTSIKQTDGTPAVVDLPGSYHTNNAEVMAILLGYGHVPERPANLQRRARQKLATSQISERADR